MSIGEGVYMIALTLIKTTMSKLKNTGTTDIEKYKWNIEQLEYLRQESRNRYLEVQDFTVSANKTDQAMDAIKNIQIQVRKLEAQNKKLLGKNGNQFAEAVGHRDSSSATDRTARQFNPGDQSLHTSR